MTAARTAKKLKNESKVTESLPTISESSRESSSRNKRPNCDFYHSLETPEKEEKSGGDETYGQLELDFAPLLRHIGPHFFVNIVFLAVRGIKREREREEKTSSASPLGNQKSKLLLLCIRYPEEISEKYLYPKEPQRPMA